MKKYLDFQNKKYYYDEHGLNIKIFEIQIIRKSKQKREGHDNDRKAFGDHRGTA